MNMDNIKIIFFDIDGTLIDTEKKQISEKMLETLIRLKQRNMILCLSTGRGPLALPHFDGWEADAFLTFNGSYCFDKQQDIYKHPIPVKDVKTIVQNAASIDRPVSIATRDKLIANGRDKDLVDYFAIAGLEVIVSDDFGKVIEKDDVYQLMSGGRKEEYPALLKNVPRAKIAAWWDRAVDIIPADSGKGTGVNKVLEYYHLHKSQALAFGDGDNDIEMFQAVGTGIAMGNASESLKAVAQEICGHVTDDGIYHYCAAHGLLL